MPARTGRPGPCARRAGRGGAAGSSSPRSRGLTHTWASCSHGGRLRAGSAPRSQLVACPSHHGARWGWRAENQGDRSRMRVTCLGRESTGNAGGISAACCALHLTLALHGLGSSPWIHASLLRFQENFPAPAEARPGTGPFPRSQGSHFVSASPACSFLSSWRSCDSRHLP